MTSPPVSLAPPSLLSSDKSGDEDDIETFAHGSVPAHAADVTEASGNIKEASRVVENTGIRLRLRIRSNGRRIAVYSPLKPPTAQATTGPLLPHGVLPVGLVLPDTVVPELLEEAKDRENSCVFNRVGGDDDEFREPSRVNPRGMSSALQELEKALKVIIAMIHPGWMPGVFSFMRSKPGVTEQEPHQDYQEKDLARARKEFPDGVPGSMIFVLEPNTKLRVYTGSFKAKVDSKARVVEVPVGFCVLFRGDLIHNVMPYALKYHRLHCYLSYQGMSWMPDVVQNVLPEHGECQYCGVKMLNGTRLRLHRFYCDKNPKGPENRLKRTSETKIGKFKCNVCKKVFELQGTLRVHKLREYSTQP
ncbi:hypothetical protein PC128_g8478 [Phytophthora cactorum]|nr:hypothetical protein PC128_g8478 [Phytophthora cactorum]